MKSFLTDKHFIKQVLFAVEQTGQAVSLFICSFVSLYMNVFVYLLPESYMV